MRSGRGNFASNGGKTRMIPTHLENVDKPDRRERDNWKAQEGGVVKLGGQSEGKTNCQFWAFENGHDKASELMKSLPKFNASLVPLFLTAVK